MEGGGWGVRTARMAWPVMMQKCIEIFFTFHLSANIFYFLLFEHLPLIKIYIFKSNKLNIYNIYILTF